MFYNIITNPKANVKGGSNTTIPKKMGKQEDR